MKKVILKETKAPNMVPYVFIDIFCNEQNRVFYIACARKILVDFFIEVSFLGFFPKLGELKLNLSLQEGNPPCNRKVAG